tara:strand:- start:88 stop:435 length:348 start_codon:yes stop_codon:yes gene_type:complete
MIDFSNKNPASCFIELDPDVDELGFWTGGLRINILTSKNNPMPESSKESLLHLAQLISSTVALMERDQELTNRLEEFVAEPEEPNFQFVDDGLEVVSKKDNIISINFKTKTKGEA